MSRPAETLVADALPERVAGIGLLIPVLLSVALSALTTTDGSSAPITLTDSALVRGLGLELGLTATLGLWLWRSGWRPHQSATRPFALVDLGRGMLLWVSAIVSVIGWALVCGLLWPNVLAIAKETQMVGAPGFWLSLAFSVFNAVFEEFLWLGLGVAAFRRFGLAWAGAISVALRLLVHAYQGPLALVTVLPVGIVFTLYYFSSRRLWPIVVAHAFQDTLALYLVSSGLPPRG